jgi:fused signal recognition particle receptor
MLAAADTFRAAAIDQLEVWAQRSGAQFIKHEEGSDPAAVAYDAVKAAVARKIDILLIDTAGRLQNKSNLMQELEKINRVIGREIPGALHETLLVLDATTGQNAISQAELFTKAAPISGVVLTKLDGTAKGGVVIGIKSQLSMPVKWIGVGEGIEDLRPFVAEDFAKALFAKE